ncbi:unnamed protein product, partial [Polarella glacialis]
MFLVECASLPTDSSTEMESEASEESPMSIESTGSSAKGKGRGHGGRATAGYVLEPLPPAAGSQPQHREEEEEVEEAERHSRRMRLAILHSLAQVQGFVLVPDRSTGSSNSALVNHLKLAGSFRGSSALEAAFRAVERGKFMPGAYGSSEVYSDSPVRDGHFHMSQPSLYADALVGLDLKQGLSFLNVGAGTGYLSSIVSEITGPATHHGVDLHKDVLDHAAKMFRQQGKDYIEFFQVNAHDLDLGLSPRYDRIYIGACAGGPSKLLLGLLK